MWTRAQLLNFIYSAFTGGVVKERVSLLYKFPFVIVKKQLIFVYVRKAGAGPLAERPLLDFLRRLRGKFDLKTSAFKINVYSEMEGFRKFPIVSIAIFASFCREFICAGKKFKKSNFLPAKHNVCTFGFRASSTNWAQPNWLTPKSNL